MECHEYEKLFEKYFDRDITILEYKAVRSHLSRCQQCRERFFDHLFALDLLDNMPMKEPADLLTEQVLQRLPKKSGMTNWRRWTLGVAACVMIAMTLTVVEQTMDQENNGTKASIVVSDIKSQMKFDKGSVVLPNNTTLKGDLSIKGDVLVLGKVYGRVQANRVIVVRQTDSDFFYMIGKKFKNLWMEKDSAK